MSHRLLVTCRPPWLPASTAALLGSVLRVPVTPLLDSSPWSTYTRPHTKQYSSCAGHRQAQPHER